MKVKGGGPGPGQYDADKGVSINFINYPYYFRAIQLSSVLGLD